MNKSSLLVVGVVIAAVVLLVIAGNGFFSKTDVVSRGEPKTSSLTDEPEPSPRVKPKSLSDALGVPEEEIIEVGGIERPKRDVAFDKIPAVAVPSTESAFKHPGKAPAIDADTNEQTKGLFEELNSEDGGPPEARSSLFAPEPFDKEKYDKNPQEWLDLIRPGRAFQPAQPGSDITPLITETKAFHNILQGEQVILEVKASPGAPITFYTPQVGEFDNRLTTQSVAANENGIATATYKATPGTNGIVNILVASPIHSGQLKFRIRVSLPDN